MNDVLIEWRPIPGWERFYEASSDGRVRSLERLSRINSHHCGSRTMGGNIRKATKDHDGYLHLSLTAERRKKRYGVHHLVLMAFDRLPEAGEITRHLDGDPSNNRADNLCWGSHLENMADRKRHGNYACGDQHVMARLTDKEALLIYYSDEPGVVLAAQFGISATMVSAIRLGHTWKEITGGVPRRRSGWQGGCRKTDIMNYEKADDAREMRSEGASLKQIAVHFGITVSTASGICSGKNWKRKS